MDFMLNDEQRLFQQAVHEFCDRELKPFAAEVDEQAHLRREALARMPDLGLLGLQVPEAYGGAAFDTVTATLAIEEIGRACGSTGLSVAAHNGLCCFPINRWGTDEQKARFLPTLTSGKVLGSLALTEPDAGSDLGGGVSTRATKEGDCWVINGSKAWITNASLSPVIIVLARTDPQAGTQGLSMLLVETDHDGLTVAPPEKKMGVRGSPTHMLSFNHVRVPVENLLGEEGRGLQQALETLDGGRVGIAALSVGLAQAAFEEAVNYSQQRQTFGKSLAQHQGIQFKLADAAMKIEAARALVHKAAWLRDQGQPFTKLAAMAKLFASETAERVAFEAIQIHGGYGYSREFPVERIYRDQRLMTIGEGASEILRMVIARQVLKENPV
jgi:alkylation response protein AidB-like acyl-CoA dehydrogenase